MNDLLTVESLLYGLAEKPCACGKRPNGDRQELVGEPITGECDGIIRFDCRFRCQVCGDVHRAGQIVKVSDEFLEMGDVRLLRKTTFPWPQ